MPQMVNVRLWTGTMVEIPLNEALQTAMEPYDSGPVSTADKAITLVAHLTSLLIEHNILTINEVVDRMKLGHMIKL